MKRSRQILAGIIFKFRVFVAMYFMPRIHESKKIHKEKIC